MTQFDLAAKLGVTRGALGHWESGKYTPSMRFLASLSDILDYDFVSAASSRPAFSSSYSSITGRRHALSSEPLLALMSIHWRRDRIPIFECHPGSGNDSDIVITSGVAAFLPTHSDYVDDVNSGILISGKMMLPDFGDGDVVMLNSKIEKGSNVLLVTQLSDHKRNALFGRFVRIDKQVVTVFRHGAQQDLQISAFDAIYNIISINDDQFC